MSHEIPPDFLTAYARAPGGLNPGVMPPVESLYEALANLTFWVGQLQDAGVLRTAQAQSRATRTAARAEKPAPPAKPATPATPARPPKPAKPARAAKAAKAAKAAQA